MVVPTQTRKFIATYTRIAGLLVERDDATIAQIKAIPDIDELLAGLKETADKCLALAVLCEAVHDQLTA